MVKLIQIDRLGPRIDGMLYRITFDEQWALLDEVSFLRLMTEAS
jgi:cytokinesis protein